jgi:hypothetical protein
MEKLYCLFSISSNTIYTTIQGCRPTADYVLLENLRAYVSMIKPPSTSSTIEILETDASCNPTIASREMISRIRQQLS